MPGGSTEPGWRPAGGAGWRALSAVRAFAACFLVVWLALALLALLLFETELSGLHALRRAPELVALRRHYYTPLKHYFKRKVVDLF